MGKRNFIGIWLSEFCNLKCRYCWRSSPEYKKHKIKPKMKWKIVKRVPKFLKEHEFKRVQFFGGEPLLHKKRIKYIVRQYSDPKYSITTNGTLLDDDFLDFVEVNNIEILLSLDGTKETQDYWRDNSYDRIMRNRERLTKTIKQVLKTCADPNTIYEDVKHIKELGFKSIYLNNPDPYSSLLKNYDYKAFYYEYSKAIKLNDKDFRINDLYRWKKFLTRKKTRGNCGFTQRGHGMNPEGKIFTCHRAVELSDEFSIGDIWNDIDERKEREIRKRAVLPCKSQISDPSLMPCPVSCYETHGKFGVNPVDNYYKIQEVKLRAVAEYFNLGKKKKRKRKKGKTLKGKKEKRIETSIITKDKNGIITIDLDKLMEKENDSSRNISSSS